jgi:hypothetical protein
MLASGYLPCLLYKVRMSIFRANRPVEYLVGELLGYPIRLVRRAINSPTIGCLPQLSSEDLTPLGPHFRERDDGTVLAAVSPETH